MVDVAVITGERCLETVYEALDLLSLESSLSDWDRVLIKVNLITSDPWDSGVTTDPLVVEGIINRLQDLGKEIFVVETDAQITNADKAVVETGMLDMLNRVGVEFINMRKESKKVEIEVRDGMVLRSFKVARIVTESALISAAKLKTLPTTGVTLGLKNMFGMLTTKWKIKYHAKGMSKVIHDINKTLPPDVTVIDAFVGLKTKSHIGPVAGSPIPLNTVIASTDPVAADATGARILDIDPMQIDHIRWLYESGIGQIDDLTIHGTNIELLREQYRRIE